VSTSTQRWTLAVVLIAAIAAFGCSQKKDEAAAPPVAQQAPAPAAPSGEAAEHEENSPTVTPAGTLPEIWAQIEGEQGRLSSAIQNGQLKDVHHLAFGIRDLVVALAAKAGASTPAVAPKLDGMVEQVKASATKLDELGDAGNLTGTQAEAAKLDGVLKAIKTATSAQ
jgi:hypothetical protein